MNKPFLASFAALLLSSAALALEPPARPLVDDCRALAGVTPICGLQAPEDLEIAPGGKALLYGEFAGMFEPGRGGIVRFDLKDRSTRTLYPVEGAQDKPGWGDQNCPDSPGKSLAPHGIHLSQRSNGDWQLLVVNHGGRESVEFFQLSGDSVLQWRGCVNMPSGAFLNDVVGLPDGSFLVTHMADKNDPNVAATALSGNISGHIFSWRPGGAVEVMPNSALPMPNGIQLSADGKSVWVNLYSVGEVRKLDRATGDALAVAKHKAPDNSNWSDDGRLLIASHTGEVDYQGGECASYTEGFCAMAFEIVALNPDTLEAEVIFRHQGAPMGAGTAAVKVGDKLYIGSFSGNRLLEVSLPDITVSQASKEKVSKEKVSVP